jgi:hypothetical protein
MGFSLNNVFGKKKSITQSEDSIEAIINDIDSQPFGISQNNVLFAGLNELGGYYFFQTVIVGDFYIKTTKGIDIILNGEANVLKLKSDTDELESDPSPVKGRHITKIDFEIEESDIETLKNGSVTHLTLNSKKQKVVFTKYIVSDEQE